MLSVASSETHLDNLFDNTVVAIFGDNIYRSVRNANGGDIAVYIQSHVPVMLRGPHVKCC